jgi:hypothetical protein
MIDIDAIKRTLKRSFALRSTYKVIKHLGHIPRTRLTEIDALQAIARVFPNTMLSMPRLFDLFDAVKQINREGLKGNLVECGVWNGGAVGLMALANRRFPGPRRKLHLFDSFEGLPQPTEVDEDVYSYYNCKTKSQPAVGEGPSPTGDCVGLSQPEVARFLIERLGVARDEVEFHVGWFQDTVPAAKCTIGDIALLRLDGDWYESTRVCICNLFDSVVSGGFVIVDDYGAFEGCRKAIDEFFVARQIAPKLTHSDDTCVYFRKDERG